MEILLLLTLAGLALALISAFFYAGDIRNRFWIDASCAGVGLAVTAVSWMIPLFSGLPAIVIGGTVWGLAFWGSRKTFEVGVASIYQPTFFRDPNSPLNPDEWLVMMPGFQTFWEFFCRTVATIEVGRLGFEKTVDVRFPEGVADIVFRVDAELPIDRPDLLGLFVQSIPSGATLTDAAARTAYVIERLTALIKRVLEAAAEQVSAFEVDAMQLQAIAEGNNRTRHDYLAEVAARAQAMLGLPAFGRDENGNLFPRMRIEVIDFLPKEELVDLMAARAKNDSIAELAAKAMSRQGMPPPDQYRLVLRERQKRDDALYGAMSDADFADASQDPHVLELQAAAAEMLAVQEFKDMMNRDTKTAFDKKSEALASYVRAHAQAQAAPAKAAAEELRYRNETHQSENANIMLGNAALVANPSLVKLAARLENEYQAYVTLYGEKIQVAINNAAAADDASVVRVLGLEGIGGASGLDALRMLGPKGGKP